MPVFLGFVFKVMVKLSIMVWRFLFSTGRSNFFFCKHVCFRFGNFNEDFFLNNNMNSFIYCYFQYQIQTKKENFEKSFQFSNLKKNIFQTKKKIFFFFLCFFFIRSMVEKNFMYYPSIQKKIFNIFGIVFFWIFGSYLRLFNEHNIKIWKYFIYLSYEQYQNSNRNSFFLLLGED